MNKNIILSDTFPIQDSHEVLSVTIFAPVDEPIPTVEEIMESQKITRNEAIEWQKNLKPARKIEWSMSAPGMPPIHNRILGEGDLQAMLITLKAIIDEKEKWEKETAQTCEYFFDIHTKINFTQHWAS